MNGNVDREGDIVGNTADEGAAKMVSMKRPRIASETFRLPMELTAISDMKFRGVAMFFDTPVDTYPPTVVKRGAFAKTLAERGRKVVVLWQHNPEDPIGRPTSLKETDVGLEVEFELDPVESGLRAAQQLKSGTIEGLSIGFDPIKWAFEKDEDGQEIRVLTEIALYEFSVVTFPAQSVARVMLSANAYRDLPLASMATPWNESEARERVAAWAGDNPERYARAFLAGRGDTVRLQIADVINGRLMAVPRAVHTAAHALLGDEHGLAPQVEAYAREHVSAYYAKAGLVVPWEPTRSRLMAEAVAALPEAVFEAEAGTVDRTVVNQALQALDELRGLLTGHVENTNETEADDKPDGPPETEPEAVQGLSDEELADLKEKELQLAESLLALDAGIATA